MDHHGNPYNLVTSVVFISEIHFHCLIGLTTYTQSTCDTCVECAHIRTQYYHVTSKLKPSPAPSLVKVTASNTCYSCGGTLLLTLLLAEDYGTKLAMVVVLHSWSHYW